MDRSESIKELAAALAKAQAALKPAVKDSVNPHYKSKFASLGAVWDACKEALAANGLSVCQLPVSGENGKVGVTTVLMHASGEFIAETLTVPLAKQDAQGVGSALSYSRRYALASFLGICSEDDDDGHAASQPPKKRAERPAPEPNGKPLLDVLREAVKEAGADADAVRKFFGNRPSAEWEYGAVREAIRLVRDRHPAFFPAPAEVGDAHEG
jgi:hypothetical protein